MIDTLRNIYNEYGLEILAYVSIAAIALLFIYNWFFGNEGTYSFGASSLFNRESYFPSLSHTQQAPQMSLDQSSSIQEVHCKAIIESIFKRPFTKIRPEFLRNDVTGQNLEIDLYNDSLKLGIEVQGQQHYKFTPFFQKNKEAFLNQKYRDEMKKQKCLQYGITLIEVPYNIKTENLKGYIVQKLRETDYIL